MWRHSVSPGATLSPVGRHVAPLVRPWSTSGSPCGATGSPLVNTRVAMWRPLLHLAGRPNNSETHNSFIIKHVRAEEQTSIM